MNGYDENRRRFLTKLGLTLGATVAGTPVIHAADADQSNAIALTADQKQFMDNYENWMDKFIEVIKVQKTEPENLENNKKIVALSDEAKLFQQDLITYMKDEDFARYYMIATERMTLAI